MQTIAVPAGRVLWEQLRLSPKILGKITEIFFFFIYYLFIFVFTHNQLEINHSACRNKVVNKEATSES